MSATRQAVIGNMAKTEPRGRGKGAMAKQYIPAKLGDDWWTQNKQRCYDMLLEFVGGEHHLGKLSHAGDGLRMTTWRELATFDIGQLTSLVVLAHKHVCRVAVATAGPRHLAIQVWARKADGPLTVSHPSLSDLIELCERHRSSGVE